MTTSSKICYNSLCKDPKYESQRRKGWKLRSGEHAELCDRCFVAYEQGTFCETFHLESEGWRKCETCGKRAHCGCIVSASCYVILDAGGIDCVACARKTLPLGANNLWPPTLLLSSQTLDRPKEQPVKSWSQMAGAYPGQWRQGPHLWNTGAQSDLQQRLSYEFDRPLHTERLMAGVRASMSMQDKKAGEPSGLNHVTRNMDPNLGFNLHREERNNLQDTFHHIGDNDRLTKFSGVNFETHHTSSAKPLSSSPLLAGLGGNFSSLNSANDPMRVSMTQSQQQMGPMLSKQVSMNPHNMNDGSLEARGGRSRVDSRAHLLSRYRPRITDQELQQISGDSNSVITPLFEKILSASDAGRIGRLVLPKKCAEAYFPPITHAEGLPLKVQDANGKEWMLQFRYWPNNNSRMYVLEGITPCIQSMQLIAGDTVTFSRIEPDGKLVMGFRKANVSPDQDTQIINTGNGLATTPDGNKIAADLTTSTPLQPQNGVTESKNPDNTADQLGKTGFIQNDGSATEPLQGPSRRKGRRLGSKSKRLRIDNKDATELSLTWEEAQELLRPPPTVIPNIVVIEGLEIEEFEEAPVFGKPTIFTTNQTGENSQWAQCDNCSKWRKLPVDALLPYRFTCSENIWDAERSSCSSAQETSSELADILPKPGPKRSRAVKVENNSLEVSDGLDTLANLAILGDGASSQQTTKHPRHRPGCSCIVCIQPPSGKGPKHKPTCTCNVCLTVKRRFRTLMERREKRQSEKEAETTVSNGIDFSSPQNLVVDNENGVGDDNEKRVMLPLSPLKAQIDLNIQPEREEEPSPMGDAGDALRPFTNPTA